jgi:hypothetical protein
MRFAKKTVLIVALVLGAIVSVYFMMRNYIADKILDKAATKLKNQYGLSLLRSEVSFTGYKTLLLSSVSLVPENGDTLLALDSVKVSPSIFPLLTMKLRFDEINIASGRLNLVCQDSLCNYSVLSKKKDPTSAKPAERNYAKALYQLYSLAFDFVPGKSEVKNFFVHYQNGEADETAELSDYGCDGKKLAAVFRNANSKWNIEGTINQGSRQLEVKVYPLEGKNEFPFLKSVTNLSLAFDTMFLSTGNNRYANNNFTLNGRFETSSLSMFHKRLSGDSIFISHIAATYRFNATANSISIDSNTVVEMNRLRVHPFVHYMNEDSKDYELQFHTDTTAATDFFQSLPAGMFNEVAGVEADGNLQFLLMFHLNSAEPDSLFFDTQMKKQKFRLRKYGDNSLLKMNTEFAYTAYEYNKPFRTFMVGPTNPEFTPLDQVSPYLRNSILTSEDGSFFFHNGFNEGAFRNSIATNYKEGKFKRGGSTISMQLIKNIYLSRHKTVARKAEEALLVWLIENNRLVSKERMFEVYLNIIELGPGVYGVGEASRFYFNKKPSELTLSESIFLASLLPHPKWFKYSFDESGNLKSYLADYYRLVANFMLRKNLITEEEYNSIQPNVKLEGPAKAMVIPSDTIPTEELEEDNEESF